MYCSKHDQQSCNWLFALLFNLRTVKLCDCDIPNYNVICSSQQGRIALTTLVLDDIFFMSCNVTNTLKKFLKIFESTGLTQIQVKNFSKITKQLHVAVVCLDEVCALSDEPYGNSLCGFTKCSNEDFKAVFWHLLTQERMGHFSSCSPFAISSYASSSSEPTISKTMQILHNADDLYNNFATSNICVVYNCVTTCFKYSGDFGLNHCNKPCDQNHIAQKMAKFQEERNRPGSGGGCTHCGWHNQG